jgi:hypothetical protein
MKAMLADYVVLGGGNAKEVGVKLPHGVRLGNNLTAFRGGFRVWGLDSSPEFRSVALNGSNKTSPASHWRML